ncbi:MAG: TIGR00282 family metallophosphoesterase [Actinobacteria bacterium]|nr:TIGR00282 family metallophosphoesterase [Actinomycetota bacterium]
MAQSDTVTILFVADIVGKPGFDALNIFLPGLLKKHRVDLCIANGENGAKGRGLTEQIARNYFNIGVDVVTGGNHSWNVAAFRRYLDTTSRVLRPLNYPDETPGHGSTLVQTKSGHHIGVINLQGRTFMYPIDCPFKKGLEEVERLRQRTNIIFIDVHAEATAEKLALAWYLDGKISALVGTHTHIQTSDERILPRGTAYITDVGMTGPNDSVIGLDVNVAIKRFMSQIPEKYVIATSNNRLNGVLLAIDPASGRAKSIERINLP